MKNKTDYKKELDTLKSEFMKLTKEKTLKESEYKKYFRLKKLYENKIKKENDLRIESEVRKYLS